MIIRRFQTSSQGTTTKRNGMRRGRSKKDTIKEDTTVNRDKKIGHANDVEGSTTNSNVQQWESSVITVRNIITLIICVNSLEMFQIKY